MNGLDERLAATTKDRVIAAALRCLAAQGLRRTTVDDIAAQAGISRATLYRCFPGGRDTILEAVVDAERSALLGAIRGAVEDAGELRGALVEGLWRAASWLSGHPVLQRLMFDEPAVVLVHTEFEQMDKTLGAVTDAVAPCLEQLIGAEAASRTAEWGARIVVSYLLLPSDGVDLCVREDVEELVDRHVLPGVLALAGEMRQ